MTPLFPARRRAEHFDSLVEGGRRDDVDRATAELLEVVGALRSAPESQPRPAFVADLREQLMAAAQTELTPVPLAARQRDDVARLTIKPTRTRRERRLGVALGAVAIIGASTSMAVASQGAIPGDALYPVKRAIENTQSGFAVGDDAKGQSMLGNASERLDEVGKLSKEDKPDGKLVQQTLDTFTQQFTDGSQSLLADYEQHGDPASIQQLHTNASDSMDTLQALSAVVPQSALGALQEAAINIFAVDSDAANVCPDPDCGEPLLELPADLVSGVTSALGDDLGAVAGGALPGTGTPSETAGAQQPQGDTGGKGDHDPSGMNPPETPITLPPATPSESSGLGDVLPGTDQGGGTTGGGSSSGDGGGGGGGKGGKHKPVDLTPVTDTVNQVVSGVVAGVAGVLNGLTGNGG